MEWRPRANHPRHGDLPVPAYDYHCDACGSTYELRQGFDAETSHTCEECGKGKAKRVLTAPRVVFKGKGWYVTDSRNSSTSVDDSPSTPATPASSDAPAASPSSSSTDSGSKPAASAAD